MARAISTKRHILLCKRAQRRNIRMMKGEDAEMQAMYKGDNRAIERVITHLACNKLKLALNVLDNMDTSARDEINETHKVLITHFYG